MPTTPKSKRSGQDAGDQTPEERSGRSGTAGDNTPTNPPDAPAPDRTDDATPSSDNPAAQLDPGVKAAQNVKDEGVAEQRPQAFLRNEDTRSDLTKRLEDADHPSVAPTDPMPESAFKSAASNAENAEEGKSEGIMMGNGVKSTKGPHEGRYFAVTRIVSYASVGDLIRNLSGDPEQLYGKANEVEGRAVGDERDGELVLLNVEEDGLEKLNEGWRGTRAGRRH